MGNASSRRHWLLNKTLSARHTHLPMNYWSESPKVIKTTKTTAIALVANSN